MNRTQAVRLFDTLRAAEQAVDEAIASLDGKVPGGAAELCHYYLTDVTVRLWLEVVSPIVREHPELEAAMTQGVGADWQPTRIPERDLQPVLDALEQLQATLLAAIPVVDDGATTPGESVGYRCALVRLGEKVQEAAKNIRDLRD